MLTESGVVRSDIRSSFGEFSGTAEGVPLTIKLAIQDAANGCSPVRRRRGLPLALRPSRVATRSTPQGATDQNYLRGVQAAGDDGVVTFQSIFPACYSGRWPHIHFEVYPNLASGDRRRQRDRHLAGRPARRTPATRSTRPTGYEQSVQNLQQVSLATDNVFGDDGGVRQLGHRQRQRRSRLHGRARRARRRLRPSTRRARLLTYDQPLWRLPMTETLTASPLARTVATTPTDIWNDSCAVDELEYAIAFGAVGATSNPTIVHDVWKKDPAHWRARARDIAEANREWTEVDIAWAVVEEMSLTGAKLLEPTFVRHGGRKGRLSMQTNPTFWRSPDRMLDQGVHFASLAPNIIVKFPATAVGIEVMEEATYRGVNVNCTVSFSVAQAVAAGEAVERGLRRREAEGLRVDDMGPVITIMMGRLEDWLRTLTERDGIVCDPDALPWSGVAVFKRAYAHLPGARPARPPARGGHPPPLPLERADRR